MKEIKHLFFTYRNGAVADTLRRYGIPHKIIFGLDVPRLAEIARGLTPSMELAEKLWADSEVRESRLLAAYLFPPAETDMNLALRLASEVRTREEADMLAFRLFKRLPCAALLLDRLTALSADTDTSARDAYALAAAALRPHLA